MHRTHLSCNIVGRPLANVSPPVIGSITKPDTCKKPYDIGVFINITNGPGNDAANQLAFVKQLINSFVVSPVNARFSIGYLQKTADVIIPFDDAYAKKSELIDAIEAIRFLNGGSLQGMPLANATSIMFANQDSKTPKRPRVLLIVAKRGEVFDENASAFKEAFKVLEMLDVKPLMVYVGDDSSNAKLPLPTSQIVNVRDFEQLGKPQSAAKASKMICDLEGILLCCDLLYSSPDTECGPIQETLILGPTLPVDKYISEESFTVK